METIPCAKWGHAFHDTGREIKPEERFASAAEKEYVAHDLQHHIKSYVGMQYHWPRPYHDQFYS